MIEISHISTDEMTVNDLTKVLLSNKFKEFIELIRVSKIEINNKIKNSKFNNSKTDDNETSNSKFNNNETSDDKNNENFMTNYYKEADKEVSFKTEEAE